MRNEILTNLYYDFARIETGADLQEANLTLSDYIELSRVLRVLSANENSHTYAPNVRDWLLKRSVTVNDFNGVYCISIS